MRQCGIDDAAVGSTSLRSGRTRCANRLPRGLWRLDGSTHHLRVEVVDSSSQWPTELWPVNNPQPERCAFSLVREATFPSIISLWIIRPLVRSRHKCTETRTQNVRSTLPRPSELASRGYVRSCWTIPVQCSATPTTPNSRARAACFLLS